jgi:hypothetical protein
MMIFKTLLESLLKTEKPKLGRWSLKSCNEIELHLSILCTRTATTAVTRFVKHRRKPPNIPQNKPPPNIPIIVVKHVKLLVMEAIGVVGILPAAWADEEQTHRRHISIKKGAALLIFTMDLENCLCTTTPRSLVHNRVPSCLRTRISRLITLTKRSCICGRCNIFTISPLFKICF